MSYSVVLLSIPLGAIRVERLLFVAAVGELKEAGESASVVCCVREDGVLEVDPVWEEVVVLIHPAADGKKRELMREIRLGEVGQSSS